MEVFRRTDVISHFSESAKNDVYINICICQKKPLTLHSSIVYDTTNKALNLFDFFKIIVFVCICLKKPLTLHSSIVYDTTNKALNLFPKCEKNHLNLLSNQ